jgi:hypothetical protein
MNLHHVTGIRTREVVGRTNPDVRWTEVSFDAPDGTFCVTVFGDGRVPVPVAVTTLAPIAHDTEEPEPDEPDEPVWRDDAGYTESERQHISDAGRGHLLR